jgi:hypothetical protein
MYGRRWRCNNHYFRPQVVVFAFICLVAFTRSSSTKDSSRYSIFIERCALLFFFFFLHSMSATGHGSYSAPPQVATFDGLLFDFDGTIVDSTDGTYAKLGVRWLVQVMSTPSGSRGKRLLQLIMLLTVVGNSNCEALAQVCGINMDET